MLVNLPKMNLLIWFDTICVLIMSDNVNLSRILFSKKQSRLTIASLHQLLLKIKLNPGLILSTDHAKNRFRVDLKP